MVKRRVVWLATFLCLVGFLLGVAAQNPPTMGAALLCLIVVGIAAQEVRG